MRKTITLISVIIITLILFGCKTKKQPIKFIYLDKLSDKALDSDRGYHSFVETILIDNFPNSYNETLILQKKYFSEHHKICLLGDSKTDYNILFYKKTNCTEYFIKNDEDDTGLFQETITGRCSEDELFSLYYERDKKNPKLWIANMKEELFGYKYHDTIYCNNNKPKKVLDVKNNK